MASSSPVGRVVLAVSEVVLQGSVGSVHSAGDAVELQVGRKSEHVVVVADALMFWGLATAEGHFRMRASPMMRYLPELSFIQYRARRSVRLPPLLRAKLSVKQETQ